MNSKRLDIVFFMHCRFSEKKLIEYFEMIEKKKKKLKIMIKSKNPIQKKQKE